MKFSNNGRKLLEDLEGKKHKLYYCAAGKPTIGIGCVVNPEQYKGVYLTDEEIYTLLDKFLVRFEEAINNNVKVPLSQNQYDALVCFVFNIGVAGFLGSTALRRLNQSDYEGCAEALGWWKYATVNGEKKPILEGRRKREIDLFNKK